MNFTDIFNKPLPIGDGQHLTLKQIVESSFTQGNHLDAGLKQAETFFGNLENVIDTVIQSATSSKSASSTTFDSADLSDWQRDPEAARALVVFDIVEHTYNLTKIPVDVIKVVDEICDLKRAMPEIEQMFADNFNLGKEVQKTLELLVREGMLDHSTMGYHPSSAMAKKPSKEEPTPEAAPEEEPAVKAVEEDIFARVFEDLGINPQIGSINILDEMRRIENGKLIPPFASNLAGAAVALYFAAKSNQK